MRFQDIPCGPLHYCDDCDHRGLDSRDLPCVHPAGKPERNHLGTCRHWTAGHPNPINLAPAQAEVLHKIVSELS